MLGAQDSKASHCGCVAVTTWIVRGRRCLRTAASAARLMHVGFTATPATVRVLIRFELHFKWFNDANRSSINVLLQVGSA